MQGRPSTLLGLADPLTAALSSLPLQGQCKACTSESNVYPATTAGELWWRSEVPTDRTGGGRRTRGPPSSLSLAPPCPGEFGIFMKSGGIL